MWSRLGMFAYYQKKGGWGAGPLTLPGGIGYQYTYLLTYLPASRASCTSSVRIPDTNPTAVRRVVVEFESEDF